MEQESMRSRRKKSVKDRYPSQAEKRRREHLLEEIDEAWSVVPLGGTLCYAYHHREERGKIYQVIITPVPKPRIEGLWEIHTSRIYPAPHALLGHDIIHFEMVRGDRVAGYSDPTVAENYSSREEFLDAMVSRGILSLDQRNGYQKLPKRYPFIPGRDQVKVMVMS